jgi:hypothetical protein
MSQYFVIEVDAPEATITVCENKEALLKYLDDFPDMTDEAKEELLNSVVLEDIDFNPMGYKHFYTEYGLRTMIIKGEFVSLLEKKVVIDIDVE